MSYEIDISNPQSAIPVDCDALRAALENALKIEQVRAAVLSISLVDNATIHTMNRDHLQHDYPTDVISFQLDFWPEEDNDGEDNDGGTENAADEEFDGDCEEEEPECSSDHAVSAEDRQSLRASGAAIEGEIIASVEMAAQMASDAQWPMQSELTLYVIHGLLHICGYDDLTDQERIIMRAREAAIMSSLGLQ